MRDPIERQKAIDILLKLQRALQLIEEPHPYIAIKVTQFALREIEQLPSAQPQIIRCKDCKHKGTKNCVANAWTTIFGVMVKDDFYCGLAERRTDE